MTMNINIPTILADFTSLATLTAFVAFYSSSTMTNDKEVSSSDKKRSIERSQSRAPTQQNSIFSSSNNNDNKISRFLDIVLLRKCLRFTLRECNKSSALASLTILSVGLACKVLMLKKNKVASATSVSEEQDQFLNRLILGGATFARLHGGYSIYEYFPRFSLRSPFCGAMWLGLITLFFINGITSSPDFVTSLVLGEKNLMSCWSFIGWDKLENYANASLILLGLAVAHFVSMDTTIDRRKENSVKNGEERELMKLGSEAEFEMNLRPFGYVALAASCVGAVVISLRDLF